MDFGTNWFAHNVLGWDNNKPKPAAAAPTAPPGAPPPAAGGATTKPLGGMFKGTNTQINPSAGRVNYGGYTPGSNAPGGIAGKIGTPGVPGAATSSAYGTQSGPTTVEDWFNQRASGTDPGWEYATGRATDAINNAYAARGGYNSSGAVQSLSDMFANATSQREGQLDKLANDATGAHQRSLEDMFKFGGGLADSKASTAAGYDAAGGSARAQALENQLMLQLTKAGVDQKTAQAEVDAILGVAKTGASVYGNSG